MKDKVKCFKSALKVLRGDGCVKHVKVRPKNGGDPFVILETWVNPQTMELVEVYSDSAWSQL